MPAAPGFARWPWQVVGLVLAVCLLHALTLWHLRDAMVPLVPGGMKRLEAVYARQVQVAAARPGAAAPAAPAAPKAPVIPKRPAVPAPAASAAEAPLPAEAASAPAPAASSALAAAAVASDPMLPVEPVPVAAPVVPPASAAGPVRAASAVASAASAAPSPAPGPAFDWPLSTRIRYRLTGWYRGEIGGTAQVEWLRSGDRYQVHLDVDAGVVSRRMSSEGRISAAGLLPQRYEEVTKVVLVNPRMRRMQFDEKTVVLASGETVPHPGAPGDLQDTASQFIQMIYVFSTQPQLLQPGGRMALQLALPHRVRPYVYEVGAQEWTEAPGGGWLETWPVRPRVMPEAATASGKKDLSVEAWLAPRLQMLPVRIRIRQDAESFLDLRIDRLPEQAQ